MESPPLPDISYIKDPYTDWMFEKEKLPDHLDIEIRGAHDDMGDFTIEMSNRAEDFSVDWETLNVKEFGEMPETLSELKEQEQHVKGAIKRDWALMNLLWVRICRREQRLETLDMFRPDLAEKATKREMEKLEQAKPTKGNGEE